MRLEGWIRTTLRQILGALRYMFYMSESCLKRFHFYFFLPCFGSDNLVCSDLSAIFVLQTALTFLPLDGLLWMSFRLADLVSEYQIDLLDSFLKIHF